MFAGDAARMAGRLNSIITAAATIFIRHEFADTGEFRVWGCGKQL
jgi:hypothetical protein